MLFLYFPSEKGCSLIVIIDYKAGNLTSVKRALDYLGVPSIITADCKRINEAERIIFPGVGHAGSAMKALRESGIDKALMNSYEKGTPILGICLGTQIILSSSEECEEPCLGIIQGRCPRFVLSNPILKIPHMGWDSLILKRKHPVLEGISEKDEFYFVHSYYPQPEDEKDVIALCEYEIFFPAIIGRKNIIAFQFHPEKSGEVGLLLLKNFAKWDGKVC
ncbi:MAG: imidazole glycerol phosphate synthase subunit HisH [Chitinispirillaceae bacterium]|nr:imidazole glycerol phosphate synthase subunit HisH [Chitinispirillaceae bacterium]